jgi:hypothetical protein
MMRSRFFPKGMGIGLGVVLALLTAGAAYADADPPSGEGMGEECPPFQKIQPPDGSEAAAAPALSWSAASGATRYDVCVDATDDGICDTGWISAGTALEFVPEGLAAGATYYWQVRAQTWYGFVQADFGDWWSFTLLSSAPGGFGKSSPADGAYQPLDPALAWEASAGADEYEFCYDQSDNGACDSSWISAGASTGAALSGLSNNRTYYWQVRALNPEGITEADGGAWWSFTARFQRFADVPVDHPFWAQIEAFYTAGITTGCGYAPLIYCPDRPVTRAEIAVFLERAMHYPALPYTPPPASHFFADMPVAGKEWMEDWVDQFYRDGITGGCGFDPQIFCPERELTRAEMAVFILRGLHGAGYTPPAAGHFFADVPVTGKEWMEPWIDQFYREGITTGCGYSPLIYCPEDHVTRAEMAVFIVRAFGFPLP